MRIWSLHPQYLDTKGLVAVWRETLLAKKVLKGQTKGYINHPQLLRFKKHSHPDAAINVYLAEIWVEASKRGYSFDRGNFDDIKAEILKIPVTSGQIQYEFNHLRQKLQKRDPARHEEIKDLQKIMIHPLFEEVSGKIEFWEKIESR